MSQIEKYSEYLKEIGLNHNIWRGYRIYFKTDKTAKAYLEFDNPGNTDFESLHEGVALKVYSNCDDQGIRWNVNRAKQIKHELASQLSDETCENWQDIIVP